MQLFMQCPGCFNEVTYEAEGALAEALDRLTEEGPWSALGDGETVEDRIYTSLSGTEHIRCPHCGETVEVTPESVGQLTQSLLAQW